MRASAYYDRKEKPVRRVLGCKQPKQVVYLLGNKRERIGRKSGTRMFEAVAGARSAGKRVL